MKVDKRKSEVFLSLGSNLGDKMLHLKNARNSIRIKAGEIIRSSSIYETEAWGNEELNSFYNQVICIKTALSAEELLLVLKQIEREAGRQDSISGNYENRVIDIDILFYEDKIIYSENLKVPHIHLHKRNFVLVGANEIVPEKIHPELNKSVKQLYIESADRTKCIKIS